MFQCHYRELFWPWYPQSHNLISWQSSFKFTVCLFMSPTIGWHAVIRPLTQINRSEHSCNNYLICQRKVAKTMRTNIWETHFTYKTHFSILKYEHTFCVANLWRSYPEHYSHKWTHPLLGDMQSIQRIFVDELTELWFACKVMLTS